MVAGPPKRVDSPLPGDMGEDDINDDAFSPGASDLKDFEDRGEVSDEEGGLGSAGNASALSAPLEQMVCSEDIKRIDADQGERVPDEHRLLSRLQRKFRGRALALAAAARPPRLPRYRMALPLQILNPCAAHSIAVDATPATRAGTIASG